MKTGGSLNGFEITGISGSLILILCFQRTKTDGSLILKQFKNWNQNFFITSKNRTTMKMTSLPSNKTSIGIPYY
jgi:hypothetical protein